MKEADICRQETTSDHHPIDCSFQLPSTPEYPPAPKPSILFRRLTESEQSLFQSDSAAFEEWAHRYPPQVPSPLRIDHLTVFCKRIWLANHSITHPACEHKDTALGKTFRSLLHNLPH